ncbi:MAG: TonB family protein [Calditrichaeota bacterium]|nr:TonB family protein [Calditrichota bacterium]
MKGGVRTVVRKGAKWCLAIVCATALLAVQTRYGREGVEERRTPQVPGPEVAAAQQYDGPAVPASSEVATLQRNPEPASRPVRTQAQQEGDTQVVTSSRDASPRIATEGVDKTDSPKEGESSWIAEIRNGNLARLERFSRERGQGDGGSVPVDVRSPTHVAEVLARHNQEILECYRQRVKINPSLEGSIDLRFVVSPEGQVTSAEVVESTLGDPELECALVNCVLRWTDFGRCNPGEGQHTYRQRYTFGVENR